ncbi:MAG: toluene tolerance protein [Deltaproteobacteria bacterium]|nr:toluene tolerance protein [Deltaproteobacteria bacterium]
MMFILLMAPLCVIAGPALDTVKTNVTTVIDILKDPKLKGPSGKKAKEQKIEVIADKMFDYVELSKRTLGLNWNKFTVDQRKEFVELFKGMLRDTYVDRITAYTNEKVNFTKEVPLTENTVEVQTVVISTSAQTPINYRAMKKSNEWKVYDVVIEGVSLVSNYRTQFRDILGNNPPQVLIDTLRKKKAGNK